MSAARQAVVLGPRCTGWGNRPDLTPAHQVDLATGMGPFGARIADNRTKPDVGKDVITTASNAYSRGGYVGLGGPSQFRKRFRQISTRFA